MCGLKSILLVQLSAARCRGLGGWWVPAGVEGGPLRVRQPAAFPLFFSSWSPFGGGGALHVRAPRFPFPSPASVWKLRARVRTDLHGTVGILVLWQAPRGCRQQNDRQSRLPAPVQGWWGAGGVSSTGGPSFPGAARDGGRQVWVPARPRQVPAACLPPPLPSANHLVIRASCIPAGMGGGCHGDGGCWLPSNIHPLAHPPWTDSACVLPPSP